MSDRLDLQAFLELILGSENVYFQPPESLKLDYPCIIYSLVPGDKKYADDIAYVRRKSYNLTLVEYDPDSPLIDRLENVPMCRFDRSYASDNLNHYVYKIYY